MGLSKGYYLALTAAELKALRAIKGDPARRAQVETLLATHDNDWTLHVGDAWQFLQHLFHPDNLRAMPADHRLCYGQSLHKGQFYSIELLAPQTLPGVVEVLEGYDEPKFRKMFFRMNEKKFRYRYVPFWVAEEWQRDGVTSLRTEERFARVWQALEQVRSFFARAAAQERRVVFYCNHGDS